ncbi:hypothetical protein Hanom_Chr16g01518901 [Helianthus anomalus]
MKCYLFLFLLERLKMRLSFALKGVSHFEKLICEDRVLHVCETFVFIKLPMVSLLIVF